MYTGVCFALREISYHETSKVHKTEFSGLHLPLHPVYLGGSKPEVTALSQSLAEPSTFSIACSLLTSL